MISYIFKSKIKNTLVVILATICILDFVQALTYILPSIYDAVWYLIRLLPTLLIFIYMITLTREYKLKNILFPAAFAIFALTTLPLIVKCFHPMIAFDFSVEGFVSSVSSLTLKLPTLAGYVLCFIGSLQNMKRISLLRLGLILCIVTVVVNTSMPYLIQYYSFFWAFSLIETKFTYMLSLFLTSILILTLTKKSENISIEPFIEFRAFKRQQRAEKKLQKEREYDEIPSAIPEGSWRCMGCGKILPDSELECECGYKK